MRSKQALKNMVANMVLQFFIFVSGIILPRFFLEAYGSNVNGMITSVSQFITYLSLAEAGVGTASVIALYTPLANSDQRRINGVLSATKQFYCRSGLIFGGLLAGLIIVFPLLAGGQLPSSMVRAMIGVLGFSTLLDYFFMGKYRVFLQANQKGYILSLVETGGIFANVCITVLLIYFKINPVLVKSVAMGIFMLRFFVIYGYVKKHYPEVCFKAEPDYSSLHQRGAALLHQVVGIIVNNTDVVLLTILLGSRSFLEVSVYGIYNMVVYAINILMSSFSNSLTAGFGEVVSRDEKEVLRKSFSSLEYAFLIFLNTCFICLWVLFIPFIDIYTEKISDVNYIRPAIAVLFTLMVFLQNVRIPSLTIICAAGHFKETRGQAVAEAVINLLVSLILINHWGMAGVLIGTICSYGYRSSATIMYGDKHLVKGTIINTCKRIGRNIILAAIIIFFGMWIVPQKMDSFLVWILYAMGLVIISFVVLCIGNYIFEPNEYHNFKNRIKKMIHKR